MLCSARLDGSYAIRMLLHSRGFLHNSRDGARERRRGGRRGKRGGEGEKKWMDLVLPFFLRGRDLQPRGRRWPRRYFRKFFNNNSRVDESLSLSLCLFYRRMPRRRNLCPLSILSLLEICYGVRWSKHLFVSRYFFFLLLRGTIVSPLGISLASIIRLIGMIGDKSNCSDACTYPGFIIVRININYLPDAKQR